MDAERWERVKALFREALEVDAAARPALVARACGGDAALRDEVESLLAAHDDADDFLEAPAFAQLDVGPDTLPAGGHVGAYRIVREIGRGGMGAVYLAERDDGEFRQQVAVKLVKRGMDTDAIVRRFRHERQILAELDHPNIARLLDGGTTDDGLPYFVMEHIAGEPIDRYCAARGLAIADRLALFRTVCAAVHYAHQRLVVHRDLKPANILVTAAGVPKLLDFGIAKLLDPGASAAADTATGLRAMTPEYASPEQARGAPVTTLSDVYSLGVLLYELLAGEHPYAAVSDTPASLAQAVADTEPARPSSVARDGPTRHRLRGDLDTIVLAAMRKDPARRYASAESLSDDIARHLDGLPVRARPDTLAYRASRFVHRNRLAVVGAAAVVVTLLGGIAATTYQARVARGERARAERRFAEVRSLATSFLFEVHDAIADLPGATPARALLVRRALTSLDGLAREAQDDPGLQRELAAAYERVGRVQGNSYGSNLGDTKGALASYGKAVEIRRQVALSVPDDESAQHALADAYEGRGNVRSASGDLAGALADYQHALALRRTLLARHPANADYREALAELYNSMGDVQGQEGYDNLGDVPGALASYGESVRLREAAYRADPERRAAIVGLTNSLMNRGYLRAALGDASGVPDLERSVALLERAVAAHPDDASWQLHLLSVYARVRQPLADRGRAAEAVALDRKMVAMIGALAAADPTNALLQRNLGVGHNYIGRDLRAAGRAAEAVPQHRQGIAVATRLVARDPHNGEHRHDLAMGHFWLAEALADTRAHDAALAEYRLAFDGKRSLRVAEPSATRHADDLGRIHAGVGATLLAAGQLDEAADALRDALPLAEAAARRTTTNQRAQSNLAAVYLTIGRLHARRAETSAPGKARETEWREARRWLAQAQQLWDTQARRGTLTAVDAPKRGLASRDVARCDSALASPAR